MTKMVDIGEKDQVKRKSRATGFIKLESKSIEKIKSDDVKKGDVLSVAQTAGILAVKNTPNIIPLTHPIPITGVDIEFEFEDEGIRATIRVESKGQTGVEMEALTGLMSTLLTIWDMVKGYEKDEKGQYPDTRIEDIKVLEKVKE
ncbi:molybdenum cofactor biosynthesis protein MoaC [candidate division MSBL1 archaeon SCGC-AAA259D18]|uniref:Molybdenum cofactor biosynthesis protein MoaC n=1 Tax=candidate division MSBL1 archaeon SCGC-AAA259D18 TaxID=1698262 RepID=A0A133UBR2_9EURY|nr:molybdenum cofactor biosynthesis protein MoaC [candidate division MSBL1 archaeon SCGC-AAA259D18]